MFARASTRCGLRRCQDLHELLAGLSASPSPYAFGVYHDGFFLGEPKEARRCRSGLSAEWLQSVILSGVAPEDLTYTADSRQASTETPVFQARRPGSARRPRRSSETTFVSSTITIRSPAAVARLRADAVRGRCRGDRTARARAVRGSPAFGFLRERRGESCAPLPPSSGHAAPRGRGAALSRRQPNSVW